MTNQKIWIKFTEVQCLEGIGDDKTKVYLKGGNFIIVEKPFEEVRNKLMKVLKEIEEA